MWIRPTSVLQGLYNHRDTDRIKIITNLFDGNLDLIKEFRFEFRNPESFY